MTDNITRHKPTRCPKCNHVLDSASDAFGNSSPREGDLTVCMYCAEILIFHSRDGELQPHRVTIVEWFDVMQNPELLLSLKRAQTAVVARNYLESRRN